MKKIAVCMAVACTLMLAQVGQGSTYLLDNFDTIDTPGGLGSEFGDTPFSFVGAGSPGTPTFDPAGVVKLSWDSTPAGDFAVYANGSAVAPLPVGAKINIMVTYAAMGDPNGANNSNDFGAIGGRVRMRRNSYIDLDTNEVIPLDGNLINLSDTGGAFVTISRNLEVTGATADPGQFLQIVPFALDPGEMIWFDQWKVTIIPEPTSVGLAGLGLIGLVVRRKR